MKRLKTAAKPKSETEEIDLDPNIATQIALSATRLESAQNAVQARSSELNHLLLQAQNHYAENGKYEVTAIDPNKGKVQRKPRTTGGDQPTG